MKKQISLLLLIAMLIGMVPGVLAFAESSGFSEIGLNASLYDAENASACEHTTGEWTVTTEPYAFLPGVKSRICTQCGETVETAVVYNT
ncbi:MAG: hypothetical protein IJD10_03905, partial [Clostridia bacterium]|nr:hypothetical protein [Clostridia bacterium]